MEVVVVLGPTTFDVAIDDRFTLAGVLYRVTFVRPNRLAAIVAEAEVSRMSARMYWVQPPENLARNVGLYGNRVMIAIKALADFLAQKMQDDMRQNAPWTDRTGNARSGLFSVAEMAARDLVSIYVSHGHTVEYGVFLELCNGGRYAIVQPTVERWLPEISRQLRALLR